MKTIITMAFLALLSCAQAKESLRIPLWPNGAAEQNNPPKPENLNENGHYEYVDTAELFVYLANKNKATGQAIVICPGGGYWVEAIQHEGFQIAEWLAEEGITAIVLKYRLPYGHYNIPLKDAQEAMKVVRANAKKWGINPNQVGVSGFSAGGHLASTLGTHFDAMSRPDFMVLFYPVVTFLNHTHHGSRDNLLGSEKENLKLHNYFSNELHVTQNTPPTLLLLSDDDTLVQPKNSTDFYNALKANGVAASMYIFPNGGHGWGFGSQFEYHAIWKQLMLDWLRKQQISQK